MPDDDNRSGRRSTDADLAVVIERLETLDAGQEKILLQVTRTNGRVSELEVKDRIRQDREEQRAIASAAAEAAKFRVEQTNEQHSMLTAEEHRIRITWRITLIAAAVGGVPAAAVEVAHRLFG